MGDGHPLRGAGEGAEHWLRPGERGLGVNHPLHPLHAREALVPGLGSVPSLAPPLQAEAFLGGRLPERRQERAPKQSAEDADREEATCGARNPRRAIQRQPTGGDEAMEVGRMVQGLAPGMQDSEKPALGASVLGITGHGLERLRDGLQEQRRDHTRMLQGEGTQLGGKGKDDMTGGDVEELPLAGSEPCGLGTALACGAVPIPAGMRAALLVTAVVTRGWVAAEDRRAARRDGLEHAALRRGGHRPIPGQRRRPILLDDVSHFQLRAGHGWGSTGAGCGNNASGLGMAPKACGLTGRDRVVVRLLRWPKRSWRRRKSTPASRR